MKSFGKGSQGAIGLIGEIPNVTKPLTLPIARLTGITKGT